MHISKQEELSLDIARCLLESKKENVMFRQDDEVRNNVLNVEMHKVHASYAQTCANCLLPCKLCILNEEI